MPNSPNYTRRRVLTIAIATAASPAAVLSLNAGDPADRRVVAESRFDVTSAPLQAEVVQLVVDFPPGAWTSWHTHGGQAINLVLEGEITLRHGGMEHPHRAGQAWTDSSGQVHAAGNTGTGKARLLTNFLLPQGAPQTTAVQDSPFEPTMVYEARFPLPTLPAEADIVQEVVDLASGWRESGLPSASRQTSSWPVRSRAGSAASASSTRRARLGRRPLAPSLARRTARRARPASSRPICCREEPAASGACRYRRRGTTRVACDGSYHCGELERGT